MGVHLPESEDKAKLRVHTILLILIFAISTSAAQRQFDMAAGNQFRIHGRLSFYNGDPSFRIWIIGTKRILGVLDSDNQNPAMPRELMDMLSSNLSDIQVFADFEVTPITKPQKGVMQMVRIDSAKNIVVSHRNLTIIRRVKGEIKGR